MSGKRFLSIILAALLIAGTVLTGCSNSSGNSSTGNSSTGNSGTGASGENEAIFTYDGETAPVVNEDVTIRITWLAQSSVVDENETLVMQEIQKAWGDKINVEWEIKDYSEYSESVGPRLNAGGSLPDVCAVPGGFDANGIYWKSGIFQDISAYYEEYGYNLKKKYESYPSILERLQNEDGSMYYVPGFAMDKDYGINMMINGKWLEAVDMEAPTTTEELYNVLKAFRDKDANGNGQADELPLTFNPGYEAHFSTIYGITLLDNFGQNDSGEWEVLWTSDTYKEYLTYMKKLYDEKLLDNSWSSNDGTSITTKVANDTVGMTMAYSWSCSYEYSASYDEYDGSEGIFHLMIPVKAPNGKQYYRGIDPLGGVYGITRECEHPDLVFAMMDYLYQDDMVKLANLGIKGTDWKENEDGSIWLDEVLLEDPERMEQLGTNPRCVPFEQSVIAIDPQFPKWQQEENAALREYIAEPLTWTPANEEDKAVYEQYITDLNKYWWEQMTKFIVGDASLDDWDAYVQNCQSMGQDKLFEVFLNSQK